jgi:hypothetical protein
MKCRVQEKEKRQTRRYVCVFNLVDGLREEANLAVAVFAQSHFANTLLDLREI